VQKSPLGAAFSPGSGDCPAAGSKKVRRLRPPCAASCSRKLVWRSATSSRCFFSFGRYTKYFPDGAQRELDMLFLLYSCRAASQEVRLNDEFEAYRWVSQSALRDLDLNVETRKTFYPFGLIA